MHTALLNLSFGWHKKIQASFPCKQTYSNGFATTLDPLSEFILAVSPLFQTVVYKVYISKSLSPCGRKQTKLPCCIDDDLRIFSRDRHLHFETGCIPDDKNKGAYHDNMMAKYAGGKEGKQIGAEKLSSLSYATSQSPSIKYTAVPQDGENIIEGCIVFS